MAAHTIRVLAESKNTSFSVTDSITQQPLFWWRGSDISIELALTQNGQYLTSAEVGTINVVVKTINAVASAAVSMIATLGAGDCDGSFDGSQWIDGSGQLCVAEWTKELAALDAGEYVLIVSHDDPAGKRNTYLHSRIMVKEDQHDSVSLTSPPTPTIEYYTKNESDSRYTSAAHEAQQDNPHNVTKEQLGINLDSGRFSDLLKDGMQVLVEGDSIFSDRSTLQTQAYPHPPRWGSFLESSPIFTRMSLIYFNNASPGARLHLNNVRFDFVQPDAERADSGRRRCLEHGTGTVVICNVGVNDASAGSMDGVVISGEPDYVNVAGWVAAYEALAQKYKDLSTEAKPIRFIACTIIDYEGIAAQALIDQANALIRQSKVFDAVIDLAAVLTDSSDPDFYIPDTLGGPPTPTDGTHPSERGAYYQFREIASTLFNLPTLSQNDQLADFDGLYSRLGGGSFSGNVGAIETYADNQAAIVAGKVENDLYLKSGEGRALFLVFDEPNFGTQFVWDATSGTGTASPPTQASRIINMTAATDTIDVAISDLKMDADPSHFVYVRSDQPIGKKQYLRNTSGNLFINGGGTGDNGRIAVRVGGNIDSISNKNGPAGFTNGLSIDYIWAPVSAAEYLKLEVTALNGSGQSIWTASPVNP